MFWPFGFWCYVENRRFLCLVIPVNPAWLVEKSPICVILRERSLLRSPEVS